MARRALLAIVIVAAIAAQAFALPHDGEAKLDAALRLRAHEPRPGGISRVIIETTDNGPADALILAVRGTPGRRLPGLRAQVASVPDLALEQLARAARVKTVSLDRPVQGTLERTSAAIGATWVRETLGFDGSGVGVAIIDSGVASWHDDLDPQHIVHFSDFVDALPTAYDDYGHGTHVAGIIAGTGYDSAGARQGIAPGANLIALKVLDAEGNGYISNVIAALDYAIQHRAELNIRVINLSVAAGVYESYTTDPLTLAAKRAVDAGIVVVTAAGNFGKNAKGGTQYGGITAPGNAPWVLTVGASSHNGTVKRSDDVVAAFSSRGPTFIDHAVKPDVIAPGVGIESLTDSGTLLYAAHPSARLWGTVDTANPPYLSLSGTSMAAPVVTGTIALMLQANPSLTPNLVKAILQYTAEHRATVNDLAQGAGFLNARGAVQLAARFANRELPATPIDPVAWNRHINWGNQRIGGGRLDPQANAWALSVTWGDARTPDGEPVTWGRACASPGCGVSGEFPDLTEYDVWVDTILRAASCETRAPRCEDVVWSSIAAAPTAPWALWTFPR